MFRFNFNTTQDEPEDDVRAVQEVVPCVEELQKFSDVEHDEFKIGKFEIKCLKGSDVFKSVATDDDDDVSIVEAESNQSDLTSGSYEGGLKIWECTFDLAKRLLPSDLKDKKVLDLGCGSGLLGILALNLEAKLVDFQDYSEYRCHKTFHDPKRFSNQPEYLDKSKFWSGDWKAFCAIDRTYDLILTAETIYNPKNHKKLHDLFTQKLNPEGTILLAAKSYYFGVGGSMKQFQDLIDEKGIFQHETLWSSDIGVKREILKLTFK